MNARRLFTAVAAVAAAAVAAVTGCNAILDINAPNIVGDAGDGGKVTDGSADDKAPDGDATIDASGDAGENLIPDPSFVMGCGEWVAAGLTVSAVDAGHTDGHACLICSSGDAFFGISRVMLSKAAVTKIGDTFHAEAWVRKAPDRDAAPDMALEVEIDIDDQGTTLQQTRIGSAVPLTETWALMSGVFTVSSPDAGEANKVTMDITSRTGAPAGTDRCFVVDDVLFHPGSN